MRTNILLAAIIIIMFVSVETDTGLKGLIFIPFLLLQIYIYRYHYSRPVTGNKSKLIAVMGLLMALSVLFQCSPVHALARTRRSTAATSRP
jgi:hypothetical protein